MAIETGVLELLLYRVGRSLPLPGADGSFVVSASKPSAFPRCAAYWQPSFAGATVTVLSPYGGGSSTGGRLPFKARAATMSRSGSRLLDRMEGSITRRLADYRLVHGVLSPILEMKLVGDNELTVIYTSRGLLLHLDRAAFIVPFLKDYTLPAGGVTMVAEG